MKISASGEYAVRLLVEFAKYDNFVALKDIAVKQDISIKFAEKIVSRLLKNGILESQRGQDGGYKLAKKPTECTIKENKTKLDYNLSHHFLLNLFYQKIS